MDNWNSKQYLRFKEERTQPSKDLISRLSGLDPKSIIDIGCGPGNSTAALKSAFPKAEVLGVDNSENMIKSAREEHENIDFMLCDVSVDLDKINKKFDIVFSNACIQWVPDHYNLLKNMMNLLNNKGVLAVQTPMNYHEPIHEIIKETIAEPNWKNKISKSRIFYNLKPEEYHDCLSEISCDFNEWSVTYFYKLKSHEDIIEWYKSTGLRPYLSALNENDKRVFLKEIYKKVKKAYPVQKNGEIIFKFPRLFFTAVKGE